MVERSRLTTKKRWTILALFAITFLFVAAALVPLQAMADDANVTVEDIELDDIDGSKTSFSSAYGTGTTIVIGGRPSCWNTRNVVDQALKLSSTDDGSQYKFAVMDCDGDFETFRSGFIDKETREVRFYSNNQTPRWLWNHYEKASTTDAECMPYVFLIDNMIIKKCDFGPIDLSKFIGITPDPSPDDSKFDFSGSPIDVSIMGSTDQVESKKLLELVNEARRAIGNDSLVWNESLEYAAKQRAAEIAFLYSHTRPNGTKCSTAFSASGSSGENIAYGQASANAVNISWTESPGHYANMTNPEFNSMAASSYRGADGMIYWVEIFSSTSSASDATAVDPGASNVRIKVSSTLFNQLSIGTHRIQLYSEVPLDFSVPNLGTERSSARLSPNDFSWDIASPSLVNLGTDFLLKALHEGTTTITAVYKGTPAVTIAGTIEVPVVDPGMIYCFDGEHRLNTLFENIVLEKDSSQYNSKLADTLSKIARTSYSKDKTKDTFESLGFNKKIADYEDDFTAAYTIGEKMLSNSRMILISIRGSKTAKNWVSDFAIGTPTIGNAGWHQGFQMSVDQIFKVLDARFDINDDIDTTYVITGHSLGAGIGNLLAVSLIDAGISSKNIYDYNFACPDVANEVPGSWNPGGKYGSIFNLGNTKDLISFLPGAVGDFIGKTNPLTTWGKYGNSLWYVPDSSAMAGHGMEHYENYFLKGKSSDSLSTYDELCMQGLIGLTRLLSYKCPVDVSLYDETGTLVTSIVDNKVQYNSPDDDVVVMIEGDDKYVLVPVDREYSSEIIASNRGVMTYSVIDIDIANNQANSEKVFDSVELSTGKTMTSTVSASENASDTKLYVTDSATGDPVAEVNEDGSEVQLDGSEVIIYRLYNRWSGEHLYTSDQNEKSSLVSLGWNYEGIGWKSPAKSDVPIYRLYNRWSGEHLYTTNKTEYNALCSDGWNGEEIKFYSASDEGVPAFRLYNRWETGPSSHHYTTNMNERNELVSKGWKYEDICWYGLD